MSHNTTRPESRTLPSLKDRLAFFVSDHGRFIAVAACGLAMGWAVLSACANFMTPLTPWAIPLGAAVIVLSAFNLWAGALLTSLLCTGQMMMAHAELGWMTGGVCLVFLSIFALGPAKACAVLASPYLNSLGMGIAVPLAFGLTLGKKTGWIWAALAFLWTAAHAFLFGSSRLGLPLSPYVLELRQQGTITEQFDLEVLVTAVSHVRFQGLAEELSAFFSDPAKWGPTLILLAAWCASAAIVGSLYHKQRITDRLAMEYLEKTSSHRIQTPQYKKLPAVVALGGLPPVLASIVLGQMLITFRYDPFPELVFDAATLILFLAAATVAMEGNIEQGKRAKARKMAEKAGLFKKPSPESNSKERKSSRAEIRAGSSEISLAELKKKIPHAPQLPKKDLKKPDTSSFSRRSRATSSTTPARKTGASEWSPGEKIDNQYSIVKEHVGGMGIVYEVMDDFSGKKYAVKTLREDMLNSTEAIERFSVEARTWVNLDHHENIVQAMLFRIVEGRPLLFLEYVDGIDLEQLQKKYGRLSVAQVIAWAAQVSRGMAYAHGKPIGGRTGIIHRDLKPANIMITREGVAKVTDFGLAKVVDTTTHLTRQATGLGTLAYMPPEQLEDARHVDKRADIYSFGAVIYELLTGTAPASGESVANLTTAILTKRAQAPSLKNPGVPPALDEIVLKCLEKDRDKRFGSFEDICAALEQVTVTSDMHRVDGQTRQTTNWTPGPSSSRISRPSSSRPSRASSASRPSRVSRSGSSGSHTTSLEAIMFIDMVDSTAMASKYGDDYVQEIKDKLGNIATLETKKHKVLFSKSTGDGFMLTFPEPEDAARAAMAIMRRVREHNQGIPSTRALKLRMGIHFGQVNINAGGDRHGTSVNLAARIEDAKRDSLHETRLGIQRSQLQKANRVLISEVVSDELKGNPEFRRRLVGYFDFQGISGRRKVYELVWPDKAE